MGGPHQLMNDHSSSNVWINSTLKTRKLRLTQLPGVLASKLGCVFFYMVSFGHLSSGGNMLLCKLAQG